MKVPFRILKKTHILYIAEGPLGLNLYTLSIGFLLYHEVDPFINWIEVAGGACFFIQGSFFFNPPVLNTKIMAARVVHYEAKRTE